MSSWRLHNNCWSRINLSTHRYPLSCCKVWSQFWEFPWSMWSGWVWPVDVIGAQNACGIAGHSADKVAYHQAHCDTAHLYASLCMCFLEGEEYLFQCIISIALFTDDKKMIFPCAFSLFEYNHARKWVDEFFVWATKTECSVFARHIRWP